MTKIDAFIRKAQDEAVPVSSLLREAKLLATELDQKDFLKWINLELEGYKKDDERPEYRSVRGEMRGWNPFNGWLPVIHKTAEIEKELCTRRTNQSARQIEELLANKSDTYEMPYPTSASAHILQDGEQTKLSLFISRTSLIGILDSVRNRLTDWAVGLKQRGIVGGSSEFTLEEKKEAQKVSRFTIENIENFHGNLGEDNTYESNILTPTESFWSKAFWYIIVALVVVIVGNIVSAVILKNIFGI
ncbi:MAG: hypothetical protein AAB790_03505 [Patescibacteria group bacterium]